MIKEPANDACRRQAPSAVAITDLSGTNAKQPIAAKKDKKQPEEKIETEKKD
ncbi:MAG: hypothetical protein ACFFD4_23710 [Candidatus Odinarchaeota archaeon]